MLPAPLPMAHVLRTALRRGPAVAPPTGRRALSAAVPRREPLLFTPGPLTTSITVKQAMMVDIGSRDPEMINVVQVRRILIASPPPRHRPLPSLHPAAAAVSGRRSDRSCLRWPGSRRRLGSSAC